MALIAAAVLICSSYTMALAVHSAETGRQNRLMLFLILTMIIGAIFIGFLDFGPFSMGIAIVIAMAKACLIVAFFMHARYESKLIRVIIAAGVVWFLIMVSLTANDYVTRGWLPFPGKSNLARPWGV